MLERFGSCQQRISRKQPQAQQLIEMRPVTAAVKPSGHECLETTSGVQELPQLRGWVDVQALPPS